MDMNSKISVPLIMALLAVVSCTNRRDPSQPPTVAQQLITEIPDFNADSAYAFVERQVLFGPRVPGSQAHAECASWLEHTMKRFADTVTVQPFKARAYNGKILRGKNIIAVFNPDSARRVLLCAHWDSRPYADHDPDEGNHGTPIDGANDGASGVGVLIEVARQFSMQAPGIGVDIIFFDLEDYGPPRDAQRYGGEDHWGLGSQFWARNPHKVNYRAGYGILLDMVGVKDATFLMEGFSMMYAPARVRKVWNLAADLGHGDYFVNETGGYITDDHYYINTIINIPTINIIHLDPASANGSFFDHWHTMNDNMDHIDKNTLGVVGKVVLHVVYNEKG